MRQFQQSIPGALLTRFHAPTLSTNYRSGNNLTAKKSVLSEKVPGTLNIKLNGRAQSSLYFVEIQMGCSMRDGGTKLTC
jgi:hypothetical protein